MSKSLRPHGTAAHQAPRSFTISWSLFRSMSSESVMPSNHLLLCHPLLSPSVFPSIRVFYIELALRIRLSKYWSFSFSINPSNEHSGLMSFRIDWFYLLQSKGLSRVFSSTTQRHQFLSTQPSLRSNSHIHIWLLEKTIALTIWTFVDKVMSFLFNTLSRFFIRYNWF